MEIDIKSITTPSTNLTARRDQFLAEIGQAHREGLEILVRMAMAEGAGNANEFNRRMVMEALK